MGLIDDILDDVGEALGNVAEKAEDVVGDVVNDVRDGLREFDPTLDGSKYGDYVNVAGEAITGLLGTPPGTFTMITEGIQELNEKTDNTFTINNIEETVNDGVETNGAVDIFEEVAFDIGVG